MSAINSLTLLESAKRLDPHGSAIGIAAVLSQKNEIMKDIPYVEANGDTYHKYTRVASEPTGSRRYINEGVPVESSTTVEDTAGIALWESYSEIDMKLLKINPNPQALRNNEALRFISGMGKTMVEEWFYGNKVTSSGLGFNGLATMMNSLNSTNGHVVNNFGDTGSQTGSDKTSAYIVTWGVGQVYGVYPRGSVAGLSHKDLGEQTKRYLDSNSVMRNMQVMTDQFSMESGLVIEDPRYLGRLCNIDITDDGANTATFDPEKLIALINQIQEITAHTVIYANRTLKTQLDIAAYSKSNGFYTAQNIFGEPVTMFRGIPISLCEGILNTESVIA